MIGRRISREPWYEAADRDALSLDELLAFETYRARMWARRGPQAPVAHVDGLVPLDDEADPDDVPTELGAEPLTCTCQRPVAVIFANGSVLWFAP